MISNAAQAFVWVWLPEQPAPVVAGRVEQVAGKFLFVYGRSYLEREDAIALSPLELPLQNGTFEPVGMNIIHSCLRDAAPDAWGRRVIGYKYPELDANELDYMLLSSSQRIGALDFQLASDHYDARLNQQASLQQLLHAAESVQKREPLPAELDSALLHGTSVGGARPKALLQDGLRHYIAKFSASTDYYDVVKAEYVAMRLAAIAGLDVAKVQLRQVLGKDVLLVERFDRTESQCRRLMLSGLSLLQLNEMEARYASYLDLADLIRSRFENPEQTLHQLFARIVFNILIGNTDDHARNHAAFWDGQELSLTPAYDICPQLRTGQEASQAMNLNGKAGNFSTLANAMSTCTKYLLDEKKARQLIDAQVQSIRSHWNPICDEAGLAETERQRLWLTSVLNPYCFIDY